ncbi:MAG: hypothetical protein ACRDI3_03410 [Actinomycetota bacterium]
MDHLGRPYRVLSDERGIIIGWIGKIIIGLVITGIIIFEAGSILVNLFTLDSTADEIAIDLSIQVGTGTPSQHEIEQSAKQMATEAGARLISVEVDAAKIVYVKLRRRADTLIVGRISYTKDWARATAEGQAGTT